VVVNSARWLLLVAAAPLAYYAAAIGCALAFFRQRPHNIPDFSPPVSVLKPMRGLDRETYQNLASFCRQQYPDYELLFCVDDAEDPSVPIIHRLMAEFPSLSIRLLVDDLIPGANNKVSKLCRLAREASHDLLVTSDSDTRVEPDYLRRVVSPFQDHRVGAVTCLYKGMAQPGFWSELEAVNITSNFMAGVLVAWKLKLRFALGATMAVRRQALAEIGGFDALLDLAADDHELGRRIAGRGSGVEVAPTVVETECASRTFREFFQHHLRRAIVTRESQPAGQFAFIFAQGLPWTLAALVFAPLRTAMSFVAGYLVLRLGVAYTVGRRGLHDRLIAKWWLVVLDDCFSFVVWLFSLFANRVVWRGSIYQVRRGRLVPDSVKRRAADVQSGSRSRI
jgi:ceramide glucosyltransferase